LLATPYPTKKKSIKKKKTRLRSIEVEDGKEKWGQTSPPFPVGSQDFGLWEGTTTTKRACDHTALQGNGNS
jgi:hypothetical protein